MMRWCTLLTLLILGTQAEAHPLAPALLELRETSPAGYAVLWRTSVSRVQGVDVSPVLPADCLNLAPVTTATAENESLVASWRVQCAERITGKNITVAGLERSGINVVLRLENQQGQVTNGLLDGRHPEFTVPEPAAGATVFSSYFRLGVEHLLRGFDHLLFVLGLLLLVPVFRSLVLTITAFTLGHSVTLAFASLGVVAVSPAIIELGIAISIMVLACELLRPRQRPQSWLMRKPWLMAGGFGLLHGLGFAGALAAIGLPQGEIPMALFGFNLGIEAGQLLLVAAATMLATFGRPLSRRWSPRMAALGRAGPAYLMGTIAAFWCFERTFIAVAGTG